MALDSGSPCRNDGVLAIMRIAVYAEGYLRFTSRYFFIAASIKKTLLHSLLLCETKLSDIENHSQNAYRQYGYKVWVFFLLNMQ